MITLYSNHCQNCRLIEESLKFKQIPYTIIDNEEKLIEMATKYNISDMPFALINDKVYSQQEIKKYIYEYKGE